MPKTKRPMVCSCGKEMNHHAEKLVDPVTPEEAAQVDPELRGIIEEMHYCQECGKGEARRAG